MNTLLAGILGYVIGALPTANGIARVAGIDLRGQGSRNPGTNNARKLGGYKLAIPILLVEIGKGVLCVIVGFAVGGDIGAVVGGLGGILGNVVNVWYRFSGGKGLAISAGVILALWPALLVVLVIAILIVLLISRSTGAASLGAILVMVGLGFLWPEQGWPNAWGIEDTSLLPYFAVTAGLILAPKHAVDAVRNVKQPSHP